MSYNFRIHKTPLFGGGSEKGREFSHLLGRWALVVFVFFFFVEKRIKLSRL